MLGRDISRKLDILRNLYRGTDVNIFDGRIWR
jgi:hypothetical protein